MADKQAASVLVGGYALARKTGADRVVAEAGKTAFNAVRNGTAADIAKKWLNSKGIG